MEHFLSSNGNHGQRQNGYTQKSEELETLGSIFLKSVFGMLVPFMLLAVGLATMQIWALAASIFSATLIGLYHLYKICRMMREDWAAGKKIRFFSFKKKPKK
jgi:hypothetical protein